jgi:CRISPR/Cas system-associated protein endoribonuclease Cas2
MVAASAKFISKDALHHLPPNEEEDLGLEIIAGFMVKGGNKSVQNSSFKPPNPLKPYELINLIAGGGPNQQYVNMDLFKNYLIENFIITDLHMVKRVIDRIKSNKKHLEGLIDVKKFDAIIKPYVVRVKKHNEIQLQLGTLKKQIFERDYTLSDFFRVC